MAGLSSHTRTHAMLIGTLLIISWLFLLIRYPKKALPISLVALAGLAMVGLSVLWQDNRELAQLARMGLHFQYAAEECPADKPLQVSMKNVPMTELQWRLAAFAPGDTVNLVQDDYDAPRYRGPGQLQPGASWKDCLPVPPLRPGYRAQTLEWRAERVQGSFAN